MNITYRNTSFGSDVDCALLAKWGNNPEIRHLSTLYKDEASFPTLNSLEQFKERLQKTTLINQRESQVVIHTFSPRGEFCAL